MKFRKESLLKILLVFILAGNQLLSAQLLKDPITYEKIKAGVDEIYNCEFDKAETIYNYINTKYPNNTIPHLYMGLMLYWKYFPIIPESPVSKTFISYLEKSVELAEKRFKEDPNDAENLLSGMGALGLMLLYYADNGMIRNVLSLAPETYKFVMRSFEFTNTYYDFYFITGLYNYYREAYPEAHPIYRPVVVFFPHGNKKLGLKQLQLASDSAIFLKAEANSFLSGIYLTFELNPAKACIYSRKLADSYPRNNEFKTDLIKDLLLMKKYDEAEKLLDCLPYNIDNQYLQAQIDILRAIFVEKQYKNDNRAEKLYWSGIKKMDAYKDFGNEYKSYAYFGLSRICKRANEMKRMKKYRKMADDLAYYEGINFDN